MENSVEFILNGVTRNIKRATIDGKKFLVAPLTMIVPGVLPGSKGPLYYPPEEVAKDYKVWNHTPIVVYHPFDHVGNPVSARHPGVLEKQGIGHILNARIHEGKLKGEGWFDVERTKLIDKRVLDSLEQGKPIELSTGLFTVNEPAPQGSTFNGRGYDYIAKEYKPDHLAILPDQVGACSLQDGCGVLINSNDNHRLDGRFISGKVHIFKHESGTVISENTTINLGKGNWHISKRKEHADNLTTIADKKSEEASDNDSELSAYTAHKDAAQAHRNAARTAANGTANGGTPDYEAAGYHGNKAQYHASKAKEHGDKCAMATTNEGQWVTISGTHVLISPDGEIVGGPQALKDLSTRKRSDWFGPARPDTMKNGKQTAELEQKNGKDKESEEYVKPESKPEQKSDESESKRSDEQHGDGSKRIDGADEKPSGPVEKETEGSRSDEATESKNDTGKPANSPAARSIPRTATAEEVNRKIDRFNGFFRSKGQHHVADWLDKLKSHINAVGPESALAGIGGADSGSKKSGSTDSPVQYWGVGTDEANWKHMGHFMEAYLARNGIIAVTGDTSEEDKPLISALGAPDRYVAGRDFKPSEMPFKNKLIESKSLPGLESSEDVGDLMGRKVTHLTDDVVKKFDEKYGEGKWICKAYGDDAAAGYGIFFPQRVSAIKQDARNTIWMAGEHLDKYGFKIDRDKDGKASGLVHSSGDKYPFGSEKYNSTINGDARHWGDKVHAASDHEHGAMLPGGGEDFMVQPAFQAVGISDAERASGKTWHEKNEGRVHLVTKSDGSVEVIPHSTWLKGGQLPVVFEDEDTRAMAKAAHEAISKLPAHARAGQVYAPDVMKTPDGYRVVELNAQGDFNGSGYLHDNHFTIDAYTSHLTGRVPAHVDFIRKLLTTQKFGGKNQAVTPNTPVGNMWKEYLLTRLALLGSVKAYVRGPHSSNRTQELHLRAAKAHELVGNVELSQFHRNVVLDYQKGLKMTRNQAISYLTNNCRCWKGPDDREVLASMSDYKLNQLVTAVKADKERQAVVNAVRQGFQGTDVLTINSMPAQIQKALTKKAAPAADQGGDLDGDEEKHTDPDTDTESASDPSGGDGSTPDTSGRDLGSDDVPPGHNTGKPPVGQGKSPVGNRLSDAQWLSTAPPRIREVVQNALQAEKRERDGLIRQIVANVNPAKQQKHINYLSKLSLQQLRDQLELVNPVAPIPTRNADYTLAGGFAPTTNAQDDQDDMLTIPTINWAEEAK